MKTAALFAGIGGLDLGLERCGAQTELMCEIDPAPSAVLRKHFPHATHVSDIRELKSLPRVDLVTAGFPCQDISLAGTRAGLLGDRSGLINEVFRLVEKSKPEFLLIENVLNLLRLHSGSAMRSILTDLGNLGYRWAYRTVDTRGFGLPQRRQRVVILASRGEVSPQAILFRRAVPEGVADVIGPMRRDEVYGFYWTEGKRGIGWAVNAVPTIKGGSTIGIPSPPAIFVPRLGRAGTPSIRDAERLQGFRSGWTKVEVSGEAVSEGTRWKMVGNAVSVPLSQWVGEELLSADDHLPDLDARLFPLSSPLPKAAFGDERSWWAVDVSMHVKKAIPTPLPQFLLDPLKPLSVKAIDGYVKRAKEGDRRFPEGFLDALERQADRARAGAVQSLVLLKP